MSVYDKILKHGEKASCDLRELYRKHGYMRFKMSKFEEYELYAHNKDFLVSDGILTFMNTGGKLMALKPDVTLSIAKNSTDVPGFVQKVHYNENVYRIDPGTHDFKEIAQTGVECIGDLGAYDVCECIMLAVKSLEMISNDYVLDISHMGIVSGIVSSLGLGANDEYEAISHLGEKDIHGLRELCRRCNVPEEKMEDITAFSGIYGDMEKVLTSLERFSGYNGVKESSEELRVIYETLKEAGLAERVHFDFSIVNDMNYYNGVIFQGFVNGVASAVLFGGKYDNLMAKMGRKSGAIGFAVYLDMLEQLSEDKHFDVDIVLITDKSDKLGDINKAVSSLTDSGMSVSVQKSDLKDFSRLRFRYEKLARLVDGEVKIVESNV